MTRWVKTAWWLVAMLGRAASALFLLLALSSASAANGETERFRFDQDNVPGWTLMSSAERVEHHRKLVGFRRVSDCRAYLEEHRKRMEDRARERNRLLRMPSFDVCEQLKVRGLLE
jgi:hypothetical protein